MTPADIRKLADAHEILDNLKDASVLRACADVVEAVQAMPMVSFCVGEALRDLEALRP